MDWSVCLSVCLLDVIMCCAKTAEPVEMVFGMWTWMDLLTVCYRWGPRSHRRWAVLVALSEWCAVC